MSRIIYRQWYKCDNRLMLHYWGYTEKTLDCFINPLNGRFNTDEHEQYTGLQDKNGLMVFGGDIVDFNGAKVLIQWNEYEAMFWGGSSMQRYITQYFDMCRVVGNSHQNPELMEDL